MSNCLPFIFCCNICIPWGNICNPRAMHFIHLLNIPTSGIEWHNLTNYTYRICSFIYRMERGGGLSQHLNYANIITPIPSLYFPPLSFSPYSNLSPPPSISPPLSFSCVQITYQELYIAAIMQTPRNEVRFSCTVIDLWREGEGYEGEGETEKEEDRWMRSCDREGEIIILERSVRERRG